MKSNASSLTGSIAQRARFDVIRYAQGWEDSDLLLKALKIKEGDVGLSICAAGDNTLSMLLGNPKKVMAIDLSPAQLACLRLRIAMYRELQHPEYLELFGSRESANRMDLLDKCIKRLSEDDAGFWNKQRQAVGLYGIGGVGKFERYFRIFRMYVLPFVHRKEVVVSLLEKKSYEERKAFFDDTWNSHNWKFLLKLFFGRRVMGWLGRDPHFFDQVSGSVADHIAERVRHALIDLDPSENPYLAWILTGRHGNVLPVALRPENYSLIRARTDRIEPHLLDIERLPELGVRFDVFNLSDIFEYMDTDYFEKVYGVLLACAAPNARMAYWNMMVSREAPAAYRARVILDPERNKKLHDEDKTLFYKRFIAEQLKGAQ